MNDRIQLSKHVWYDRRLATCVKAERRLTQECPQWNRHSAQEDAGDGPVAKNDLVARSANMRSKPIRRMPPRSHMIRPCSSACDELHHRVIIIPGVSCHTGSYSVRDDRQRETMMSKGGADGMMFGRSAVQQHRLNAPRRTNESRVNTTFRPHEATQQKPAVRNSCVWPVVLAPRLCVGVLHCICVGGVPSPPVVGMSCAPAPPLSCPALGCFVLCIAPLVLSAL